MSDRNQFLQEGTDGKEGVDPRKLPRNIWGNIVKSPIKAIRKKCVDCSGGQREESPEMYGYRLPTVSVQDGDQHISHQEPELWTL